MMKSADNSRLRLLILVCAFALALTQTTFAQTATPTTPPQNDKAAQAEAILKEGFVLFYTKTAESLPAAFTKYETARTLFHELDDKSSEIFCILLLGRISDILGEKQKTLEFYKQALPLLRLTGEKSIEATTLHNMGY